MAWLTAVAGSAALAVVVDAGGRLQDPAAAHRAIGRDAAECLACHAEVASHKVLHGPVASRACLDCHEVSKRSEAIVVTLARSATRERPAPLCLSCHTDIARRVEQPNVHAPVEAGACTMCHDAHGSPNPLQLRASGNALCLSCHQDIAQALALDGKHPPAVTACVICHDPHAAASPFQTRLPLNDLCFACHRQNPPPSADMPPPAELAGHKLTATEAALMARAPQVNLNADGVSGHPVRGHPVFNRREPLAPDRPLTCASCHNPHGARARKLFRFGARMLMELCLTCHPR